MTPATEAFVRVKINAPLMHVGYVGWHLRKTSASSFEHLFAPRRQADYAVYDRPDRPGRPLATVDAETGQRELHRCAASETKSCRSKRRRAS